MIRAALKSLLARKVRLLLSTFAIVLGVAFVAGTLIFSDTLNRSFTALFASTVGDVVVQPHASGGLDLGGSTRTVPAELVPELAALPGAARADGMVNAFGVYVVGRNGKALGGFGPPALGGNWSDAPAGHGLEGLSIVRGRAPAGADEVVLDARTAAEAGYDVGDTVPMVTIGSTANLTPTLVGVAGFEHGGSLNGATLALFETHVAQQLFLQGADAYSEVWVTAKPGVSQSELAAQVKTVIPDDLTAETGDKAAHDSASDLLKAISFLTTFLLIFAGISLVVGAYLIVNTFSMLLAQRSRELALLRALGASRRQVTRSVLLEAFALGVLGATAGLALGVGLAVLLRALFGHFGLDLSGQPLVFRVRTFVAAYAVGVLVTMASAWLPARRTSRIAPVQALRDDVALPETSMRRRFWLGLLLVGLAGLGMGLGLFASVPHQGWWVGGGALGVLLGVSAASPVLTRPILRLAGWAAARALGPVGHLAGQNSLRNPRRTTATASALMIGLTVATTMSIFGASAKASVDREVAQDFVGDYVVSSIFAGSFSPTLASRIAQVDGVASVVRERADVAEYKGEQRFIAATDPSGVRGLELRRASGSLTLASGQVLLRDTFAEGEGYDVGDRVTLDVPSGKRSFVVAGTYRRSPIVFGAILMTVDDLAASGYPPRDALLVVTARPGTTGLQQRLDAALKDQPIVTAKDQDAFAAQERKPIDQFVLLIYALLALAVVIAALGIVNTLALSVIERTREVGLLRAVGLSRRQLRTMVRVESVVIALLGALLGVGMGILFGVTITSSLRDQGLSVIRVPLVQLSVFLVLSVVIGVLAAVLPARRAARLDVLRAIATD